MPGFHKVPWALENRENWWKLVVEGEGEERGREEESGRREGREGVTEGEERENRKQGEERENRKEGGERAMPLSRTHGFFLGSTVAYVENEG